LVGAAHQVLLFFCAQWAQQEVWGGLQAGVMALSLARSRSGPLQREGPRSKEPVAE
jgi:hypothetical protein